MAILFGAAFLAACGGSGKPGVAQADWLSSLPEAFQTAQQKNRIVFVAFVGSDWSVASQGAMEDILDTEMFKNYADENLVLLRIDFSRKGAPDEIAKNNADWARLSQVDSLPTFALVDPRGGAPTLFWKGAGYGTGGPDNFINILKNAIQSRLQTVAQQGPQGPMAGQPPTLAPAQAVAAPGLKGMPSAQDLMGHQLPQAPQLPTSQSTSGLVPSDLPAPDQLMNQVRPAAPEPTSAPVMNGLPSPADLMKQVTPAPAPTAPAPSQSAAPADTTQPMFNINQLK